MCKNGGVIFEIKFLRNTNVYLAIFINFIYLIGFNIFFLPQSHVDDIQQWYYINGAYTGKTSYHLQWGNAIYGYLLKLLADLFPNTQWYTIGQYMMSFVALTILTYIILEYKQGFFGWIIINAVLLIVGYEVYIAVIFTKTAGIVGAIASFGMLSDKISWKGKVVCWIDFVFAYMLRSAYLYMFVGVWVIVLFIHLINHQEKMKIVSIKVFWLFLMTSSCLIAGALSNNLLTDDGWDNFSQRNAYRSAVYDGGKIYEDYDEHKNEYENLGITKAEATLWYTNNFDGCFPDEEIMEEALDVSTRNNTAADIPAPMIFKYLDFSMLQEFLKVFPKAFTTMDVFFLLIILAMFFMVCDPLKRQKVFLSWVASLGILLLLNYYLYINGRYLRHRVDVALCLIVCLCFLYFIQDVPIIDKINKKSILMLMTLTLLYVPFNRYPDDYGSTSQTITNLLNNNKAFYDQTNVDQDHGYFQVISSGRSGVGFYDSFVEVSGLKNIPRGYYRNIFFALSTAEKQEILSEYGVTDLYVDIVNNDAMYLILPADCNMEAMVREYIRDRCKKEIQLTCVKQFMGKKIYRVNSVGCDILSNINEKEKLNSIEDRTSFEIENNVLRVNGKVKLADQNVFTQNVYLKIKDKQTNTNQAYYVFQDLKERENVIESEIFSEINLPEFYDSSDEIYLIVENNGLIGEKRIYLQYGESGILGGN